MYHDKRDIGDTPYGPGIGIVEKDAGGNIILGVPKRGTKWREINVPKV